ncbi:hypothetical protein [Streptomyces sp. NPDC006285]|uniref:hypothetical protein n=1 Tax=Streptomyces sp. NPDC006285 TaxID=3364742 RepID=UPI0036AD97F4
MDTLDVREAQEESAAGDDAWAPQYHQTRSGMRLLTGIDVVCQQPLPQLLRQYETHAQFDLADGCLTPRTAENSENVTGMLFKPRGHPAPRLPRVSCPLMIHRQTVLNATDIAQFPAALFQAGQSRRPAL